MKYHKFLHVIILLVIILLPYFSFSQEMKEFQSYLDNKEKLDDIEGIYLCEYFFNSSMEDTYYHTSEKSNDFSEDIIAVIGNENSFYVYLFNKETNLFRKLQAITIEKINNLYIISSTDKEYYNLSPFAILGNSFTLSLNRRVVTGQFVTKAEYKYVAKEKLYPKAEKDKNEFNKSATCFLISAKGHLITNYHVIKNAKNIYVTLSNEQSNKHRVKAELLTYNEELDIAVLKTSSIKTKLTFTIKNKTTDVGTSVFTLGFPMTSTLGTEIKLSTGIINSKSGFKGDTKYYQISNPIQPGNSGGPLFDNQGNLIGLVTSKYTGGDNVGYALKSTLILNYLESLDINFELNQSNTISKLPLQSKFKSLKNFVFYIEVE